MMNHSIKDPRDSLQKEVINELKNCGKVGEDTSSFLENHKVQFILNKQNHSAAAWSLSGNINLDRRDYVNYSGPDRAYLLSLIVHETCHLRQGFLNALSVYGELDAWQTGFRFYSEVSGKILNPVIRDLLEIPLNWDRNNLQKAADLMKVYSPGYRIHLLPLYPIFKEINWQLLHKKPVELE